MYVENKIKVKTPINPERLAEEILTAFPQIDPMYLYESAGDSLFIQIPQNVDPAQIQAILDAHDPSQLASGQVLYNSVSSGVELCVGLTFSALTEAQKDALLYALLYNQGVIDPKTQTIKAGSAWLRQ